MALIDNALSLSSPDLWKGSEYIVEPSITSFEASVRLMTVRANSPSVSRYTATVRLAGVVRLPAAG
jgi:hypothetical protein